jgi:hypothetical protein
MTEQTIDGLGAARISIGASIRKSDAQATLQRYGDERSGQLEFAMSRPRSLERLIIIDALL